MEQRITTLSVPLDSVHLDPERPSRATDTPPEDHLLRSSIRRRGILEPLQISDEGANQGHVIIDGERRFRVARDEGYDRLVCVVHPHMSREDRAELRMELKLTVKPVH
jgi:ParB-like chromosome segregation protein Spo0J